MAKAFPMETLSSRLTFVCKFFPVLWAPLLISGWVSARHVEHAGLPLLAGSISVLLFGLMFFRLKRVHTDGHSLFVSNYFRAAVVPLSLVEGTLEHRPAKGWRGPTTVSVLLRDRTRFGRRFIFLPPLGSLDMISGRSSISSKLDRLIERAQQRTPGSSIGASR